MPRLYRRTGIAALVGLLLVVFAIAGLLVHEAWSTGRSRRQIAERGLQDYAAYATWSTARAGDDAILASLSTMFRGLVMNRAEGDDTMAGLPALIAAARYQWECDCSMTMPASYYFRYNAGDGSVEAQAYDPASSDRGIEPGWAAAKVGSFTPAANTSVPDSETLWLRRSLHSMSVDPGGGIRLYFASMGDSARIIAFSPHRDAAGRMTVALGFVASAPRFASVVFAHLWRHPRILPLAITHGLPSDSLLVAAATTPAGIEIYRSKDWTNGLRSDTASLGSTIGGMRVRVGLRPDAAARLQGGLLPASRVPVWLGMLILTGLLTVIIVNNLRREHELSRLRLEFSAGVSHELRTPLAQILLFSETLALGRTRSENERHNAASVIVREARRLMQLVDNTLTFSRKERPTASLSPRNVILAPLVAEVIAGFEPIAAARGVTIANAAAPGVEAFVDPEAFRQMLLNLLDNAVKYGPPGQRVMVGLIRSHSSAAKDKGTRLAKRHHHQTMLRVTVDDEGPGISGRAREEVWTAFVRGMNGNAPVGTGCGLGLAVVRELAERHDGTAWVEPRPNGRGSRFVIELPATIDAGTTGVSPEPQIGASASPQRRSEAAVT
ncbi:MAG: HAMP domain-containing sensor histidine kinase [Gemmatimonadaceae bacterium]